MVSVQRGNVFVMDEFEDLVHRVRAWAVAAAEERGVQLSERATADQVADVEAMLGYALHPLLKRLYLEIANGEFGPDGWRLMPVERLTVHPRIDVPSGRPRGWPDQVDPRAARPVDTRAERTGHRRFRTAPRPPLWQDPDRAGPLPPPPPPRVRAIGRWIMTDPEHLSAADTIALKDVRTRCPELDAVAGRVCAFATMMSELSGHNMRSWCMGVRADDLPTLHSPADGFLRDEAAVTAGLTLPRSSGPVEGAVTRIKFLKRQCFGRAEFDLLRKRILPKP